MCYTQSRTGPDGLVCRIAGAGLWRYSTSPSQFLPWFVVNIWVLLILMRPQTDDWLQINREPYLPNKEAAQSPGLNSQITSDTTIFSFKEGRRQTHIAPLEPLNYLKTQSIWDPGSWKLRSFIFQIHFSIKKNTDSSDTETHQVWLGGGGLMRGWADWV